LKIGFKLKSLRENKRRSQQEVADFLNISQRTYSNIESDKSDIACEKIFKLSKFLDFDYYELIQNNCSISLLKNVHSTTKNEDDIISLKKRIHQYEARVEELQELNALLKEKIERIK
jgi:transcriptional regulator with XRE-family HTH domain